MIVRVLLPTFLSALFIFIASISPMQEIRATTDRPEENSAPQINPNDYVYRSYAAVDGCSQFSVGLG